MQIDLERWYQRCLHQLGINSDEQSKKAKAVKDALCCFVEDPEWLMYAVEHSAWGSLQEMVAEHTGNEELRILSITQGKPLNVSFIAFMDSLAFPYEIIKIAYPKPEQEQEDDHITIDVTVEPVYLLATIDDLEYGVTDYLTYQNAIQRGDFVGNFTGLRDKLKNETIVLIPAATISNDGQETVDPESESESESEVSNLKKRNNGLGQIRNWLEPLMRQDIKNNTLAKSISYHLRLKMALDQAGKNVPQSIDELELDKAGGSTPSEWNIIYYTIQKSAAKPVRQEWFNNIYNEIKKYILN